ncbi:MAG: AAA family ATPase [Candidatus Omnitrophota bacterium]
MDNCTGQDKKAEIWAVGGGKGGTGKTFVICQLAASLASMGRRVILIDTDFGGANVHTFFGIRIGDKSISDFFNKKEPLENLITETQIKNLSIICGNSAAISPANVNYAQKIKLMNHIRNLPADYILLDLGGGTSMDTIDVFLLADKPIVVALPEITAIENLYQFIKSVYFRKLKSIMARHGLKDIPQDLWEDRRRHDISGMADLVAHLKSLPDGMGPRVEKEIADFSIDIVLNKVRNVRELQEGFSIRSVCIKYIGVNARYSGYIEYDFHFWRNLSLIHSTPRFVVAHSTENEVQKIAGNIIKGGQMKIDSLKL